MDKSNIIHINNVLYYISIWTLYVSFLPFYMVTCILYISFGESYNISKESITNFPYCPTSPAKLRLNILLGFFLIAPPMLLVPSNLSNCNHGSELKLSLLKFIVQPFVSLPKTNLVWFRHTRRHLKFLWLT